MKFIPGRRKKIVSVDNDAAWEHRLDPSLVAVVPCSDYDPENVYEAVKKGLGLLGGVQELIGIKEKVLLKPNMLTRADIDNAVTTHPAVFEAVIRCLKEEGYKKIKYGDSPGHPGSVSKTAEICGIEPVAKKYGIDSADFSSSSTVEYNHGRLSRKYEICNGVLESDAIVNICKMKTHQLEVITGAVKNLFGCVYGLNKGASHAKFPDADSFAQMLIELNIILEPRLHIMDGIVAMEGNGPASGTPKNMNVLLFSTDPVALDAVFCELIDLDGRYAPTVYFGDKLFLGNRHLDNIEIVGVDDISQHVDAKFDVARDGQASSLKWRLIKKLKFISKKPVIDKEKCIKCGVCVQTCPLEEKAIFFNDGYSVNVPAYDYKKCIRCYCCQEMCPEGAIETKYKLGR